MTIQKKFDRDYLKDYWNRETDSVQKFVDNNKIKNLGDLQYPQKERFKNLHEIYSYAVIGEGVELLPQIPCTGSLIIPLMPYSTEEEFKKNYGFDSKNIQELIDFSKTGQIQFIIEGRYFQFENLGFLKPIFEKINPPVYLSPISLLHLEKVKEFSEEIQTNINFRPTEFNFVISQDCVTNDPLTIQSIRFNFIHHYAFMRLFGYEKLADEILLNTGAVNFDQLHLALTLDRLFDAFILPSVAPFHARMSVNMDSLNTAMSFFSKRVLQDSNTQINPYEIGSFLLQKSLISPSNFKELNHVMEIYKENEYLNVYSSIDRALKENALNNKQYELNELDQILKNIWQESDKVGIGRKKIQGGIIFSLAAIGACVQNYPGLIASLGTLGTPILASYSNEISSLFSNASFKPHLVNIYNFKTRFSN